MREPKARAVAYGGLIAGVLTGIWLLINLWVIDKWGVRGSRAMNEGGSYFLAFILLPVLGAVGFFWSRSRLSAPLGCFGAILAFIGVVAVAIVVWPDLPPDPNDDKLGDIPVNVMNWPPDTPLAFLLFSSDPPRFYPRILDPNGMLTDASGSASGVIPIRKADVCSIVTEYNIPPDTILRIYIVGNGVNTATTLALQSPDCSVP